MNTNYLLKIAIRAEGKLEKRRLFHRLKSDNDLMKHNRACFQRCTGNPQAKLLSFSAQVFPSRLIALT